MREMRYLSLFIPVILSLHPHFTNLLLISNGPISNFMAWIVCIYIYIYCI